MDRMAKLIAKAIELGPMKFFVLDSKNQQVGHYSCNDPRLEELEDQILEGALVGWRLIPDVLTSEDISSAEERCYRRGVDTGWNHPDEESPNPYSKKRPNLRRQWNWGANHGRNLRHIFKTAYTRNDGTGKLMVF